MMNVAGYIPKIKYQEMTVSAFLKLCRPFKDQFSVGNTALVNGPRVQSLKPVIYEALSGIYGGPVTLMRKNRILAGNHRWLSAAQLLSANQIDGNFKFQVKIIDTDDADVATKIAWLDNHGGNKANKNTHKVEGAGDISCKVFKPIYEALTRLDCLTASEARKNAVFLGAYFNNNTAEVARVKTGYPLTVQGFQIYAARGFEEANDNTWFDSSAKVDLTGQEDALIEAFSAGAEVLKFIKKNSDWTNHVSSGKSLSANIVYIFLAASARGELREKARKTGIVTVARIKRALEDPKTVKALCQLVKDFNRKPELCENTILDLLT